MKHLYIITTLAKSGDSIRLASMSDIPNLVCTVASLTLLRFTAVFKMNIETYVPSLSFDGDLLSFWMPRE